MTRLSGVASGVAALALALGAQATVVRELYDADAGQVAAAQLALDFLTTGPQALTARNPAPMHPPPWPAQRATRCCRCLRRPGPALPAMPAPTRWRA